MKQKNRQYNASQLLTQREGVSRDIRRILAQRARGFNLILEDVSITQVGRFEREQRARHETRQKKEGKRKGSSRPTPKRPLTITQQPTTSKH